GLRFYGTRSPNSRNRTAAGCPKTLRSNSGDLAPPPGLHSVVHGPFATLRRHPHDILRRILDVARLAVHAVLRIDLQPVAAVLVLHELVNPGRTIPLLRPRIFRQV